MACNSHVTIARIIDADRTFIKTCWYIYATTLCVGIGLTLFLHLVPVAYAPTVLGMLAPGSIAFPFIPKHLQRIGAIQMLNGLNDDCYGFEPTDPECKRIADNVDALLRSRGAV